METIIAYTIKFSISITLLYSVYWFFLRKETFYQLNRIYLVSSILLSLIISAITFKITTPISIIEYNQLLDEVVVNAQSSSIKVVQLIDIIQVMLIIYFTGAVFFLVRFIFQIIQLLLIAKRFNIVSKDGLNLIFTDSNYVPFSFFNLVFLSKNIQKEDVDKIIAHELIHVKQHHSFDIILMELLLVIQWFNPIVWFYKYSLREIHEYLADDGVLLNGYEKVNYQNLLLSITLGGQVNDLCNNFNHSLIKRRFIMMSKIKSGIFPKFKVLIAIPLLITLLLTFAQAQNKPTKPKKEAEKETTVKGDNDKVYEIVDEPAKFNGGDEALIKFISSNVKYPQNAKEKGIQGKVFVSFIIDKTGKIKDVKVDKSVNPKLDKEAIRVVKLMPKWTPGKMKKENVNVKYILPINFKLDKK